MIVSPRGGSAMTMLDTAHRGSQIETTRGIAKQCSMKSAHPRLTCFGKLNLPAATMRFSRDQEIYGEEEEAEFVYKVVAGTVRTTKILSDGRRQIEAFYLAGEIFGLESGGMHRFSAEAVVDAEIALIKRSTLKAAALRDPHAAESLWALTEGHLRRTQDHLLLLGRKSAQERLVSFLLELPERSAGGKASIELSMSRTDIADYLGLTIETVSRMFTQLERNRSIELPNSRQVVLRNRQALTDLHG
jgi:CRP/FNR family transcriptional regulator, nitrogen fixation regulation protein